MRLNHDEQKILGVLNERMVSVDQLMKMLGKGYTELKVQSMILSLARTGNLDKGKAALLLRGTAMMKFLSRDVRSGLKGTIPKVVYR